ncbi:MAG: hypothetical protein B6D64_03380 [Bacteroidetes bacterium 4484_276]|nr:MAG: hypothetical protein B6D64_03380 [Bacteroidetes bacterium 4484_276]
MYVASVDLDVVNNFYPDESVIPNLYNSFRTAVEAKNNSNNNFKDGFIAEDKPLDESLWLLETSLNTNYGFRQDSLVDFTTNVFEFTIINKSINASGMPVIDGQDFVDVYCEMVETIGYTGSENEFFRLGMVEVSQVTTETSSVILESESGFYWAGVLPPGVDPVPFPPSTVRQAYWAAIKIAEKINIGGNLFPWEHDPAYILLLNRFYRTGKNYPEYLWYVPWGNCGIVLGTDELNQYLMSTKDFVDLNNPINDPDRWMAQIDMECFTYYEAYHMIGFRILERVYIGGGTE